jgi:hypothetical protein
LQTYKYTGITNANCTTAGKFHQVQNPDCYVMAGLINEAGAGAVNVAILGCLLPDVTNLANWFNFSTDAPVSYTTVNPNILLKHGSPYGGITGLRIVPASGSFTLVIVEFLVPVKTVIIGNNSLGTI